MGIFNKKPTTAEGIVKLIKELPEDEFEKLSNMLLEDEDDDGKPDTIEKVEKAEEDIEADGKDTQTEKDRIDECVAEQDKADDEDSQDAKDRVDEAEGEEKALEEEAEDNEVEEDKTEDDEHEEKEQEAFGALERRIDALEEKIAHLVEKLDDAPFGNHSAEITEGEADGLTEDSQIMKSYMRKQAYR